MKKLGVFHVVFAVLVVLMGMAIPYQKASAAGPTITDSTATPNMVSLFGDNKAQTRTSPFGPNWTTVVANVATTPTSITASVGDFFKDIMPADANIRTKSGASSTGLWDTFISGKNSSGLP